MSLAIAAHKAKTLAATIVSIVKANVAPAAPLTLIFPGLPTPIPRYGDTVESTPPTTAGLNEAST